ncbi:type II toxin-antitoxin system PemK/MazF family toxin [Methanospirillum sp.]|uniref:type II toxin-antitoxin system PemK/MazF family toxin n=1 Tax=Methanospirillum sp. TaxID=45200 RepID=UPI0035A0C3D9
MVGARVLMYQWHIFVAQLSPVYGSEQSGQRPVLVISREQINQILPVVNIIPLTSRKSSERIIYPNEVFLPKESANLSVDSIALCYQIRTLDKKRLTKEIGCIHDENLIQQIHDAIRFQLEL